MDDAEFREQYKPVYVPSAFSEAVTLQDQVVFALAELGEGSAGAVSDKLESLEPGISRNEITVGVEKVLTVLYEKGLIAGRDDDGLLIYNLNKITEANDGKVNPDLLAPGLD